MAMTYVKPAPRPDHLRVDGQPDHLIVRDPVNGQVMSAAGRHVDKDDPHWLKRIEQGDVIETDAPAQEA